MPESAAFEGVCPHCKKSFSAKLMGGRSARHRGFKCPHCKLFVPAERTGAAEERAAS
jgi:transposase-like protein